MSHGMSNEHLSAERLQAFLEGELPPREAARAEEHLAGCARCSAECEAWRLLLADLGQLPSLRPDPGFAERVMSGVRGAEVASSPLAAAAREHVGEVDLLEYLDGTLGPRRAGRVELHLAACPTCADEAKAWSALLDRLDAVERFAPSGGFADRVLAGVRVPERLPLAARIRARAAALLATWADGHVDGGRLQDYVEGALPARQLARIRTHVEGCAACASEAEAWSGILERLGALERFAPGDGFQARVMAGVRVPAPVAAASRVAPWARALAYVRRWTPRTRRAWAAISGAAVTPAVTGGLVLWAVFSHPGLTLGTLASFLWWQVADLASAGWAAVSGGALESAELFGVYSLFEALASAPTLAAGGAVAYSLVSALALRVLYKNIISNRPPEGRYVRVQAT